MKPRFASIIGLVLMCGAALWSTQALPQTTISPIVAGTKHNLSKNGPGTIKAATETEVCVFCHVPHNASNAAPLWNRPSPTGLYTPYWSSTTKGGINGTTKMGLPNGTSLLCLSCHDGTIALGNLVSRSVAMSAGNDKLTSTNSPGGYLGTDLSDDHPISFVYNAALATANGELVTPANNTLTGQVKLDASSQMQCSSCHDPHNNQFGNFLVMDNTKSALCVTCHDKKGWSASSHATSTKAISPAWPRTSATSVAANACESCHRPHKAGGNQRLLNGAADDGTCFTCHGPTSVASTDIKTVMSRSTAHAVTTSGYLGIHDPTEPNVSTTRHVACADCHNPHKAISTPAGTNTITATTGFPTLPGSLNGVKGVDTLGTAIPNVTYEYEVCFRCHAASPNKPTPTITRTTVEVDFSKKFQPATGSFHPVVKSNPSAKVASLISPLTANSTITCSACHSNNAGPNSSPAGTGPKGPHGSTNLFLLERAYATGNVAETTSGTTNTICYKCHSLTTLKTSASWSAHSKHIGSVGASCSVCHDPHGVTTNTRLINFDTSIVSGSRTFTPPVGLVKGYCSLSCHGEAHGVGQHDY
jgi:predicted CXXCH cytochrome family protein